jgi:hypothetical protein
MPLTASTDTRPILEAVPIREAGETASNALASCRSRVYVARPHDNSIHAYPRMAYCLDHGECLFT